MKGLFKMLSNEKILELGRSMLGLGAPIRRDNAGFNRTDFQKMIFLQDTNKLTTKQSLLVVKTLKKYKKTQLVDYANDIEETIAILQEKAKKEEKEKEKILPIVEAIRTNSDGIFIRWGFSKKASSILKENFTRSEGFWKKNKDDEWEYCISFDSVEKFIKMMKGILDTKALTEASVSKVDIKKKNLSLVREDDSIDTLLLCSEYDRGLIDICKKNGGKWRAKETAWEIPFSSVINIYNSLSDDKFEKSSFEKWVKLFSSWTHSPKLIDVGKITSLKWKPYPFQIKDAKKLLSLKAGLNGNEVGCGKTFEQVVVGESINMPKLVICPATLRINWFKEIKMVNPTADVKIVYSDKKFEVGKDWTIIGYPSLVKFQKELENEIFQVVMMDEAHFIQAISSSGNPDSQRAKVALRLVATSEFVYPITGTPKTNRNKNLYNILRAIRHPLTHGKSAFFEYAEKFCDAQRNKFGWDFNGNSNDEHLNEEIRPIMVRHLKKDVLPNIVKMRQALPQRVDLREYHRFIDEYKKEKGNNVIALSCLTKAKQSIALQKVNATIEFTQQMVEQGEKVVVVTCFTEVVNQVCEKFNCPKIVGGMSDKDKNQAVEDFQNNDDIKVIVLNIVAGGVGLTLTASHRMVINDIPWTTGELEQAEGRIWRSGQTETAMVYYMIADGCKMDEYLQDVITKKSITINTAIDGGLGDTIDFREMVSILE